MSLSLSYDTHKPQEKLEWRVKKHNQYAQISWTHLTESGDVWLKEKWPLLPMAVKTGGTSVNNQMKGKAAKV